MNELRNTSIIRDSDEISLEQLLAPMVHHWKFIVGLPLAGTLLFAVLFYFFAPRVYMSAADMVVMVPKFKTEFQERMFWKKTPGLKSDTRLRILSSQRNARKK